MTYHCDVCGFYAKTSGDHKERAALVHADIRAFIQRKAQDLRDKPKPKKLVSSKKVSRFKRDFRRALASKAGTITVVDLLKIAKSKRTLRAKRMQTIPATPEGAKFVTALLKEGAWFWSA